MRNKKTITLLLCVLMVMVGMAHARVGIVKVETEPTIAHRGDVVKVNVFIRNFDTDNTADAVVVNLKKTSVSEHVTINPLQNTFNRIEPYGTVVASYYVVLPENDTTSYYSFTLTVYRGLSVDEQIPIYIHVEHRAPILMSVSAPKDLEAGKCYNLTVKIHNTGDAARDLVIKPVDSNPFHGVKQLYIQDIGHNQTLIKQLPVCVDQDTPSGYESFVITYQWYQGENRGADTTLTQLHIVSHPKLLISGVSSTPRLLRYQHSGTIHVYVENIGTEPVFALRLYPEASWCQLKQSNFAVSSQYPLFRGMSANFDIYCNNITAEGNLTLPMRLVGVDRYGHRVEYNLTTNVNVSKAPYLKVISYTVKNPYASEEAMVEVKIKNVGDADAKHVTVESDVDWPFSTGAKRDYVDDIPPGGVATASLPIDIYPNAKEKGYGLSVDLDYYYQNDYFTNNKTLVVRVKHRQWIPYIETWVMTHKWFSLLVALAIGLMLFFTYKASKVS